MRRVKLKIKRLDSTSNRQVTYSKRRNGILKKAKELSILCDIDIFLLMFSLTGKATLFRERAQDAEECWTQLLYTLSQSLRSLGSSENMDTIRALFSVELVSRYFSDSCFFFCDIYFYIYI
ncbi:hypothetical protein ACSBR1_019800 [Camellia fascicularis]